MTTRLILCSALASGCLVAQQPMDDPAAKPASDPVLRAGVKPLPAAEGDEKKAAVVAEAGWPVPSLPDSVLLGKSQPPLIRQNSVLDPVETRELRVMRAPYGGLLGEAMVREQPWQLVNPWAPAVFGDGTQHLTQDLFTGRGEGLVLFSIRLGGSDAGKTLAERRERQRSAGPKATLTSPVSPPPPGLEKVPD